MSTSPAPTHGVRLERRGRVALITLDRPAKINALDGVMYEELLAAVREFRHADDLDVAVITGAGGNFSAGGDTKWFAQQREQSREHGYRLEFDWPPYRELQRCEKPVIAAIDGWCIASGIHLALFFCDMRIAAESAKFLYPVGARRLMGKPGENEYPTPFHWYMNQGDLMYFLLSGEEISAAEAKRMGLVNEVVESSQLLDRALALAERISTGHQPALWAAKRLYRAARETVGTGAFVALREFAQPDEDHANFRKVIP